MENELRKPLIPFVPAAKLDQKLEFMFHTMFNLVLQLSYS